MATTKTPKPTLPTPAATPPAEDPETIDASTPPPEAPAPAPEPETPADTTPNCDADGNTELHAPAKSVKGSTKGAAIEGKLLAVSEIRPAITDHRVQLVGHIYPDGTCDALTTTPPRVVIASRILAGMMQQPRFVSQIVGRKDEREKATAELASKSLALADELLRQAAASHFGGNPEADEEANSEE